METVRKEFADLKKKEWKLEWVTQYPEDPDNLPEAIYKHAYAQHPPAKQDMEGMQDVELVRSNHCMWSAATGQMFYPQQMADLAHMNNLFHIHQPRGSSRERSPRRRSKLPSVQNPKRSLRYEPQHLAI